MAMKAARTKSRTPSILDTADEFTVPDNVDFGAAVFTPQQFFARMFAEYSTQQRGAPMTFPDGASSQSSGVTIEVDKRKS